MIRLGETNLAQADLRVGKRYVYWSPEGWSEPFEVLEVHDDGAVYVENMDSSNAGFLGSDFRYREVTL